MGDIETIKEMFEGDGLDGFGHDDQSEVIEEGDWTDEGKYSYSESIIRFGDKFYSIQQSRSGSYYTDYYYNDPEITEVTRQEKTVVQVTWVPVKE